MVTLSIIALLVIIYWGINYYFNRPLTEEEKYVQAIEFFRHNRNTLLEKRISENDSTNALQIYYYPPNPKFRFFSKLYYYKFPIEEWVTKSLGKKILLKKIGYFKINYNGKEYKLQAYSYNLFRFRIYFTDLTTGVTTSKLNRYLEFKINDNKDYVYDIDFNFAYFTERIFINSESVPLVKDNKLDFAVEAGERFKIKE